MVWERRGSSGRLLTWNGWLNSRPTEVLSVWLANRILVRPYMILLDCIACRIISQGNNRPMNRLPEQKVIRLVGWSAGRPHQRCNGWPPDWLSDRLGIQSAITHPIQAHSQPLVQVASIWHNVANIGDIQLIISLPNFAASNRKWAVCLPSVANPRFPPKALFPLRRGKIYVRPNIASIKGISFCFFKPFSICNLLRCTTCGYIKYAHYCYYHLHMLHVYNFIRCR